MAKTTTTDIDRPSPRPSTGAIGRFRDFLAGVMVELRKVIWPTRPELWAASAVVLIVVVATALFLWGVDRLMQPLVDLLT